MRWIALILGSLLLATTAGADPLSADRPGVTNPPDVVALGAIQLEGGIQLQRETRGGGSNVDTVTLPQSLMRAGMPHSFELRVYSDGWDFETRSGERNRTSVNDLVIGSRVRVLDPEGLRPATALELDVSLPTGSHAVTSDGIDPSGLLLVEWKIGDRFVLDGNLGLASVSLGEGESGRSFQVAPSLSLSTSMGERGNVFIEYYSTLSSHGVADEHAVDGGFSWLVNDDLQLDISASAGLNAAAPDYSVSAGFAWRFSLP
jgi:hypothetical protein